MAIATFGSAAIQVPLREEPTGVYRVGQSRVLLELVIRAFKAGATPEAIVQAYDTLDLADVYAVVTAYLANPVPFEAYLQQCDQSAESTRTKIESSQPARPHLRETLLARAKAMEQHRAQAGQ